MLKEKHIVFQVLNFLHSSQSNCYRDSSEYLTRDRVFIKQCRLLKKKNTITQVPTETCIEIKLENTWCISELKNAVAGVRQKVSDCKTVIDEHLKRIEKLEQYKKDTEQYIDRNVREMISLKADLRSVILW